MTQLRRGRRYVAKHSAGSPRVLRRFMPVSIVLAVVLAVTGGSVGVAHAHKGTALPGVSVGGVGVSGMTREEVLAAVEDKVASTTVSITVEGTATRVSLVEAGVSIDAEAVADAALEGSGSVVGGALSLVKGRDVPVAASVDEAAIVALAQRLDAQLGSAPVDASVQLNADGTGFEAVDGATGVGVDRTELSAEVLQAAQALEARTIELTAGQVAPDITLEEAQTAADQANALVAPEVSILGAGEPITADAATRASWIDVSAVDGSVVASLSRERVSQWVDEAAASIERTAVNAVENVDANGTVLEPARPAKNGVSVTNRDTETDAVVAALEAHEAYSGEFATQEVAAGVEQRVVPAGPERFAYSAKEGEKWVDVNLTDSTLTAYEGYTQVYGPILINHGGVGHETVTGTYHVYLKYESQDMGCTPEWEYCERGVPWVAYWHQSYALHGAPWTKEFGIGTDESSHGCVNISVDEAHWIYDWVEIGTTVVTHY